MATPTRRDHAAEAYGRLLHQFKDKPNLVALLAIFMRQFDELEAAIYALLVERTIYAAVGAQLDQIGAVVGQPRNGMDDDTYRRYILARVAANNSDGLVEDLIDITRLILNSDTTTVQVVSKGFATVIVRALGDRVEWSVASIIIELLRFAAVGAARVLFEFLTWPTMTLTKSAGGAAWNAGAFSIETIAGDGYVEVTADSTTVDRIFGLSFDDPDQSWNTVEFGIHMDSTAIAAAIENGSYHGGISYVVGDVFRVERVGTTVSYKKNGTTFYTSTISSTGALHIDTSFLTVGAALSVIRLFDNGVRRITTWQSIVNVTVTPTVPQQTYAGRMRYADSRVFDADVYPKTATDTRTAFGGFGATWSTGWLFNILSGNDTGVFGAVTMTAVGTPTYGTPGPRRGTDKAIGFDADADAFTGGNVHNIVAASDLLAGGAIYFDTTASNDDIVGKGFVGGVGPGYYICREGAALSCYLTDGVATQKVTIAINASAWYAWILAVDRTTQQMRIAVAPLATAVASASSALSTATVGSPSNALSLNVGDNGTNRALLGKLSCLYMGSGVGVAGTIVANLPAAVTSFANYIMRSVYGTIVQPTYGNGAGDDSNRYYGGPCWAVKE